MKLHMIRPSFWINPDHVTNAWINSNDKTSLRFNLSSDRNGEENVLIEKYEIERFCKATGMNFPFQDN